MKEEEKIWMFLLQRIDNVLEDDRYGNYTCWALHIAHKSQKNTFKAINNYSYFGEEKGLQNQFLKHHLRLFCLVEQNILYPISSPHSLCIVLFYVQRKNYVIWATTRIASEFSISVWFGAVEKRNPRVKWEDSSWNLIFEWRLAPADREGSEWQSHFLLFKL